jgi:hypothetical protein
LKGHGFSCRAAWGLNKDAALAAAEMQAVENKFPPRLKPKTSICLASGAAEAAPFPNSEISRADALFSQAVKPLRDASRDFQPKSSVFPQPVKPCPFKPLAN